MHFESCKCVKIVFGRGCVPDPAGGAYSAPLDHLARFGPLMLYYSLPKCSRMHQIARKKNKIRKFFTIINPDLSIWRGTTVYQFNRLELKYDQKYGHDKTWFVPWTLVVTSLMLCKCCLNNEHNERPVESHTSKIFVDLRGPDVTHGGRHRKCH